MFDQLSIGQFPLLVLETGNQTIDFPHQKNNQICLFNDEHLLTLFFGATMSDKVSSKF